MRRAVPLLALFGLSALSPAAPVPVPAVKVAPVPAADPDAADFDKPPKGALRQLGSRQMRHSIGGVGDFAGDGRTLFTAGYGLIREWDTDTRTLRRSIPITDTTNVMRMRSTPEGGKLLFDDFKKLHVWDRAAKKRLHVLEVPDQMVQCHAVSPDGKTVAVGTFEGHVRLFDLGTGKPLDFDVTHPRPPQAPMPGVLPQPAANPPNIRSLAWSPDGRTLVSSAQGEGVRGWDPATGRERWVLENAAGYGPVAYTADGKHLLAPVFTDGRYQYALWDAATREKTTDLEGFAAGYCVAVSRDGEHFAAAGGAGEVQVWDVKAKKVTFTGKLGSSSEGVAFSRDGKTLACSSNGVHLYDVATGRELLDDTGHAGQVVDISTTPDGGLTTTAGSEGTARVWDTATGKLLHTFRGHTLGVAGVSLSPDGKTLATGDHGAVRVFDLKTGKELWKADGLSQVGRVAHSPDGRTLAVGGGNLTVHLYDARSGDPIHKLVGYNGGMNATWHFAWTPDSTGIVSPVNLMPVLQPGGNPNAVPVPVGGPGGEGDGKFRLVLWDVKTGERSRTIGEPSDGFHSKMAISPDGKHLLAGWEKVALYDLQTGKEQWAADVLGCEGLAFTGDGTVYVGRVCLNAKTGKKESELFAGQKNRYGIAVAVPPKGKVVLTATADDNTVVVWPR